jgi:hypothetical protein
MKTYNPISSKKIILDAVQAKFNNILTDAMSKVLNLAMVFDTINDIRDELQHEYGDYCDYFFKGGLALNLQVMDIIKIMRGDPNLNQREVGEFWGLVRNYMAISDCDTCCMIREDNGEAFKTKFVGCIRIIRRNMFLLRQRIAELDWLAALPLIRNHVQSKSEEILETMPLDERWARLSVEILPFKRQDVVVKVISGKECLILVRHVPKLDNTNNQFYYTENHTVRSKNPNLSTAFSLIRIKCNFKIILHNPDNPYEAARTFDNCAGEVFDVSVPHYSDIGRRLFFHHNHRDTIKHMILPMCTIGRNLTSLSVQVSNLMYMLHDLEFSMYDFRDPKTVKRQIRYVLLVKLIHLLGDPVKTVDDPNKEFYKKLKKAFAPMLAFTSDTMIHYRAAMDLQLMNPGNYRIYHQLEEKLRSSFGDELDDENILYVGK